MKIKIATWNMGHCMHVRESHRAWEFLVNDISADIALIQEALPQDDSNYENNIVWKEIGGNRRWGSGVVTKSLPVKELHFKNDYPGALVGTEITLSGGLIITAFSLYGTIDQRGYAITTLHRMFSDLTPFLAGLVGGKRNIVIGGDFNASLQCDEQWGGDAHKILFDRLEDLGLVNCFSRFYTAPVQTLRHKKSEVPWQNDYIFVSQNIAKGLKSCETIDNKAVRSLSDHNPVIAEFDI